MERLQGQATASGEMVTLQQRLSTLEAAHARRGGAPPQSAAHYGMGSEDHFSEVERLREAVASLEEALDLRTLKSCKRTTN